MNVASILTTAVGLIALLGGAAAYFGKSRGDSIIQYQADELALNKDTIARLQAEKQALYRENQTLKDQVGNLTSLAQGSPQLAKLTSEVHKLIREVKNAR